MNKFFFPRSEERGKEERGKEERGKILSPFAPGFSPGINDDVFIDLYRDEEAIVFFRDDGGQLLACKCTAGICPAFGIGNWQLVPDRGEAGGSV